MYRTLKVTASSVLAVDFFKQVVVVYFKTQKWKGNYWLMPDGCESQRGVALENVGKYTCAKPREPHGIRTHPKDSN